MTVYSHLTRFFRDGRDRFQTLQARRLAGRGGAKAAGWHRSQLLLRLQQLSQAAEHMGLHSAAYGGSQRLFLFCN